MEVVKLDPQQLDLILMWALSLTCSIAFCLGYLANEMGAK